MLHRTQGRLCSHGLHLVQIIMASRSSCPQSPPSPAPTAVPTAHCTHYPMLHSAPSPLHTLHLPCLPTIPPHASLLYRPMPPYCTAPCPPYPGLPSFSTFSFLLAHHSSMCTINASAVTAGTFRQHISYIRNRLVITPHISYNTILVSQLNSYNK